MTILMRFIPVMTKNNIFLSQANKILRNYSSDVDKTNNRSRPMVKENEIKEEDEDLSDDLEAPTNCCMSGCADCVWIRYAEKLSRKLANSSEDVQKIIMDKVQDPNMRAFLAMELRYKISQF